MARAALSALRALEIIDLMASQPGECFSLSDVVRLTGTNGASCHAVLNVMVNRGYLLRNPERKTYRLAPSIVAIGEAAASHDPLLDSAREAAKSQATRTGYEALLTARAGADIIAVARFTTENTASVSLRVGQRVPLAAPLGGLFIAWDSEAEICRWCASAGAAPLAAVDADHARALALLRERGFLASLRSAEHGVFTRQLTGAQDGMRDARLGMLLRAMDNGLYQPDSIDPDREYRVRTLSAPIFDGFDRVLYNIGLSFPDEPVRGAVLLDHAYRLVEACTNAGVAGLSPATARVVA